ncbi:LuxR C-terminal-related transcriptional regulator [Actinokineospora guangxiensis]|uniref:LuxR C-terminal-related transcriptional regulator n=1 Tax=Actinokineospora guangxiensis TaxID=1490288 RepID=A0ABW0EV34_9PSEU
MTGSPTAPVRAAVSAHVTRLSGVRGRVLELIASGRSSKEICRELFLSRTALDYHVMSLRGALRASNRASIVARAYHEGLLVVGVWPPELTAA